MITALLSLPPLAQNSRGQEPSAQANEKFVAVEATGTGSNKLEALNEAWNDAVRRGLGMFVMSKTEVIDDQLTEQIVALSKGRINSYEELFSEKGDNAWRVKIRAYLERDILEESAQKVSVKVATLDPQELGNVARQKLARAANAQEKLEAKKQLVSMFFENHNLYEFYELSDITKSIQNDKLVLKVNFKLNYKFINSFRNDYIELLDQIAINKNFYNYNQTSSLYGVDMDDLHKRIAQNKEVTRSPFNVSSSKLEKCGGFLTYMPISSSSFVAYCLENELKEYFLTPINSYIRQYGNYEAYFNPQIQFKIFKDSQLLSTDAIRLETNYIFFYKGALEFKPYIKIDYPLNYKSEIEITSVFDIAQFDLLGENISDNITIEASLIF
jgi:hypothetical protein